MDRLVTDIGLAGRGAKRYGSVLTPQDLIHNRNFNDGKEARRRTSATGGITFAQFAAAGMKAAMRNFEFGFYKDGANPFGPGLQESEDVNPRIILFGRRYSSLSSTKHLGAADLGPPCEKELAIVYRQIPRDPHIVMPFDESNTVGNGPLLEPGFTFQGTPVLAASLIQWNYMYADLQYEWASKFPEEYLKVRPIHIWNGFPRHLVDKNSRMVQRMRANLKGFKENKGWGIDGAVMMTAGTDGSAPQRLNGFRTNPDGTVSGGKAVKSYHVTVAAKGQAPLLDITLGEGMTERARVSLVLRKCAEYDRVDDNSESLSYNLVQKGIDENRDATGMTRTVPGKFNLNGQPVLFRPYQLCVVSDPTGKAKLDPEYGEYVDEAGDEWADGVILPVSVVFSAPIRTTYTPPAEPVNVRPLMDGRKVLARDHFEAIMDPDDGLRCIS